MNYGTGICESVLQINKVAQVPRGVRCSRVNIDGGLCQICRDAPGYIVHHKVWLTPENITDPDIALNPANFLYVCHDCHNKIENDGGNLYYFDENGQPQPADKANASGATPP